MPTLSQLKYILAVEQFRHFGKAADHCHVSQPSLSMQIQKVEDELGLSIFDRNKKPILPTPKGERFIHQAKVVVRENEKLIAMTQRDVEQLSGDYRLGMIPTLTPYLLPLFVESFSEKFPLVKLKIDEIKTETIVTMLKDDQLDGAILVTPLYERTIVERTLFYESFFVYCGSQSPFFARKKIRGDELEAKDLWLLQDGHCFRNQVAKLCGTPTGQQTLRNNIQFEGGNLETLRHLIKGGRGFTLVPELFVRTLPISERNAHVKEIESPVPLREVSFVSRRDQWKIDVASALEVELLDHLPEDFRRSADRRKTKVIPI